MRFKIERATAVIIDGQNVANIGQVVVDCDRWWDARHVGLLHFGCEVAELRIAATTDEAAVFTRWVGTDNGHDVRRMEFRLPDGAWRPIVQYNDDKFAAQAAQQAQEAAP